MSTLLRVVTYVPPYVTYITYLNSVHLKSVSLTRSITMMAPAYCSPDNNQQLSRFLCLNLQEVEQVAEKTFGHSFKTKKSQPFIFREEVINFLPERESRDGWQLNCTSLPSAVSTSLLLVFLFLFSCFCCFVCVADQG